MKRTGGSSMAKRTKELQAQAPREFAARIPCSLPREFAQRMPNKRQPEALEELLIITAADDDQIMSGKKQHPKCGQPGKSPSRQKSVRIRVSCGGKKQAREKCPQV